MDWLKIIENDPSQIINVPEHQLTSTLIEEAVKYEPDTILMIPPPLATESLRRLAVSIDPYVLTRLSPGSIPQDEMAALWKLAASLKPLIIGEMPPGLPSETVTEARLTAVGIDFEAIEEIPELELTIEIVKAACARHIGAIERIGDKWLLPEVISACIEYGHGDQLLAGHRPRLCVSDVERIVKKAPMLIEALERGYYMSPIPMAGKLVGGWYNSDYHGFDYDEDQKERLRTIAVAANAAAICKIPTERRSEWIYMRALSMNWKNVAHLDDTKAAYNAIAKALAVREIEPPFLTPEQAVGHLVDEDPSKRRIALAILLNVPLETVMGLTTTTEQRLALTAIHPASDVQKAGRFDRKLSVRLAGGQLSI
ncbi:hypothetical protein ACYPKM_05180 [Pseudomonas aeruginosa]